MYADFSIVHEIIPHLVTEEENTYFLAILNSLEVRTAVFNLDPDSAPDPDGFPGSFFV